MTKIVYLVNQYPSPSLTFIRREIQDLEQLGVTVIRTAVRPNPVQLVDPLDFAEKSKTSYLLRSYFRIFLAVLGTAIAQPRRLLGASAQTWKFYRRANENAAAHVFYLMEACVLSSIVKQFGASHIHAHFGTNSATVAALAAVLSGTTYSFTVHGPDEFDQPRQLAMDLKVRDALFVVAISSFTRSQLCRWVDEGQWNKIHVIKCGLDSNFMNTEPEERLVSPRVFLSIGRLSAQKGQAVLVDAFKDVVKVYPDAKLHIVGDGELRPSLERLIQTFQLEQNVKLVGWISGDEVKHMLKLCRALVMSSFGEGLPIVIMEAMASSRPVITTNIAGIAELVTSGENGWLVPAGSAEALAKAMMDCLMSDDEELVRIGKAARRSAIAAHNSLENCQDLKSLFESGVS